jgi:hypothetical protein
MMPTLSFSGRFLAITFILCLSQRNVIGAESLRVRMENFLVTPSTGPVVNVLVISDAHSPKNQLLLDGVQKIAGRKLPITGGSVNKNAGQNWVYFRGTHHTDSVIALLLTGPFKVTQTGRQAKTNEAVIETAREGSAAALKAVPAKPFAVLAFNCAGRKGKLTRLEDELEAIQALIGKTLPLFGSYCAGEYGPADVSENNGDGTACGRGWHVMFTVLTK